MAHHEGFLQAIYEEPDDDTHRLVYADWLDDHGDSERAEFIRLQCKHARLGEYELYRNPLPGRQHELLGRNNEKWLGDLRSIPLTWRFRRGFPDRVYCDTEEFLAHAESAFRHAPLLRDLELLIWSNQEFWAFIASGLHLRLRRIELTLLGPDVFGDEDFAALAAHPEVLQRLGLFRVFENSSINPLGLGHLLRSPHTTHLHSLVLNRVDFRGMEWSETLVNSPCRRVLQHLSLHGSNLRDEDTRRLGNSSGWATLRSLALSECAIGDQSAEALAQGSLGRHLIYLSLDRNAIGDLGATALASSPRLSNLRSLSLGGNRIGNTGAWNLVNSPIMQGLMYLGLNGNPIDQSAIPALNEKGGNRLGSAGIEPSRVG